MNPQLRPLLNAARGGRVARSAFQEASALDRRAVAAEGIRLAVHGGFPDATRVIFTLYPEHIPSVDDPVRLLSIRGDFSPQVSVQDISVALGIPSDSLGDAREDTRGHGAGFLVATTVAQAKALEGRRALVIMGAPVEVDIGVEQAQALERSTKTRTVVVPSLRVDVVGAKGFGVSRAYFQGGVQAGKVSVNGRTASSSTIIEAGDTLTAEGLGRIEFKSVQGDTRRGNHKIELETHK